MSEAITVHSAVEDGVAVLTVDNPPINALSNAVRAGLATAVDAAAADGSVRAIVIVCAGRTFIAGADVREFGKPRTPPTLAELCDRIEACAKPVVAAIHGTALGGGLEVALACHYRIAAPDAALGLPEVTLGLIPGAGGINRLTRLAGAEAAMNAAVTGARISASTAQAQGIVDRLASGDLRSAAIIYARRLTAPRPTRALTERMDEARASRPALDALAAKLLRKRAGEIAAAECVRSLDRALDLPFDAAIEADRTAFAELAQGEQSKALRHIFFAEREASRPPAGAQAADIAQAAVIGAGTMGGGIAMAFAAAGRPVTLIDASDAGLERGLARIRANYAASLKRGSIGQAEIDRRLGRITGTTDLAAAVGAGLVIEAVFEDMALKQTLFAELEAVCAPDTILATNTSALDVDAIAAGLKHRQRFVGMHFFSPANVMKLCEVVVAKDTSDATIATAMAVAKAIGKIPVIAGNCDGFIGNRMVAKRSAQAERLLQEGASPHQVDAAIRSFGFPMGPLQTNDMSGLDIGYAIRKRRGTHFPIADAMAESGRLGQKTGAGYYRYDDGSREPIVDPDADAIIAAARDKLNIEQRTIDAGEMTERMLFPLVNEGARILEEGIARRPSDIDVVWIHGYGFPRWRGGPMHYADTIGLAHIAERLRSFAAQTGDASLQPAALLVTLAAQGIGFSEWQKRR